MKKILIFIYVMFIPNIVLSATMCAKNNTLVVALDPGVGGSGYSYSALDSTWQTTFSYGSVKGVSACTSYAGSMGQVISTTTGKTINATRGEESGRYCWCKVVHPVSSLWAFSTTTGVLRIALRTVRATAVITSRSTPLYAVGCSGRSRLIDVT